MSRFSSLYHDTIVPELMKKFGYKTVMQVPRITKSRTIWVLVKPLMTRSLIVTPSAI